MEAIQKELKILGLESAQTLALEIPLSTQQAYAIEVTADNKHQVWQHFKNRQDALGVYPVLTATWGPQGAAWSVHVTAEDFFSRFYFAEESPGQDLSPEAIIARAAHAHSESILADHNNRYSEDLKDYVSIYTEAFVYEFGEHPDEAEIFQAIATEQIQDYFALGQWYWNWAINTLGVERLSQTSSIFLNAYEPTGQTELLLLLPTTTSEAVIAYMHWYGACNTSTEKAMQLLKQWHDRYGAEIVAHYGTMLHLKVKKKPESPAEAFVLATEQEAFAPCTTVLSGATLCDLAIALMHRESWFLHERP
jgi:hypothetical protein